MTPRRKDRPRRKAGPGRGLLLLPEGPAGKAVVKLPRLIIGKGKRRGDRWPLCLALDAEWDYSA